MKHLFSEEFLAQLGLAFDKKADTVFGVYKGYHVYIRLENTNSKLYAISCSVIRDSTGPDKELLKEARHYGNKALGSVTAKGYKVTAVVKSGITKNKRQERMQEALDDVTGFLSEHSFKDCCEETGQTEGLRIYMAGGEIRILSPEAYAKYSEEIGTAQQNQDQAGENVLAGIVGAFLGSLIGVLSIVIFDQMNYVVWISGLIMGFCAVKGYEMLGRKFSAKSAVISFAIIVIMTYFANELNWAIRLSKELGLGIFEGFGEFQANKDYLLSFGDISSAYWHNLILLVLFTLIGAGAIVYGFLKDSKDKFIVRELSADSSL